MNVTDILKRKGSEVITTSPTQTLAELVGLLSRHKIGAALVTQADGAVAGIISERDVVNAIAHHGHAALAKQVSEVMTGEVVCCYPSDDLTAVMTLMTERRIRHLPVMRDGELKGLISIGDVVKHRLEEAEQEVGALRSYVSGAG